MNHRIPEHPHFRPGTVDHEIWAEVIEGNCYGLPDLFEAGDWVIDVGAHTGSFCWRVAVSGASVVAVEPARENFSLLLHNLQGLQSRVVPINAAIWRSDRCACLVPFQRNWAPANTGGGCTMGDAATEISHQCLGLPLDDLLRLRDGWRLLKLDCEGAEFPILYTSRELGRVGEVAGEYHERAAVSGEADAGPCRMAVLAEYLSSLGFVVEVTVKAEGMGLFWARRG